MSRTLIARFRKSIWTFPAVVLFFAFLLILLRISGTSAGVYHQKLYGPSVKDPNLVYGKPQPIRSDEWLVGTQVLIGQSKLGFPRVNSHMGAGQDLTLRTDTPTKDWATIFRPQLWGYFILPLEYAFAYKWWAVLAALIISCYFFTLRVLPGQKLFAAMFSTAIALSPFELWWYQSGAFMVVAYGFMVCILAIRLINNETVALIKNRVIGRWAQAGALAFVMSCFGLIFYPPFQIPIAMVILFFGAGYLCNEHFRERIPWFKLLKKIVPICIACLAAGVIGGLFVLTHQVPLRAQNSSIYPGHRIVSGNDLKLLNVFDAFLMPVEQSFSRATHFIGNQSESSNFILLLPFLLIPGLAIILARWRKEKYIDWVLLALTLCSALFFIRVFTPYGASFFKLFLLHRVTSKRLIIGFGFMGVLYLLYILKAIGEVKISRIKLFLAATIYAFACFVTLLLIGLYVRHHFPKFLHNFWLISALAGFFSAIIAAFLANWRRTGAALLLTFTILSGFHIMPLYRGLGELNHTKLLDRMAAISDPNESWVTVGDDAGVYENFGLLAGRRSISGTQAYPNLKFWNQVAGSKYEYIYNRQAHAFFTDSDLPDPIMLNTTGTFLVEFTCSKFISDNANFTLSVHPLTLPCVKPIETVKYPNITFYLSKIVKSIR